MGKLETIHDLAMAIKRDLNGIFHFLYLFEIDVPGILAEPRDKEIVDQGRAIREKCSRLTLREELSRHIDVYVVRELLDLHTLTESFLTECTDLDAQVGRAHEKAGADINNIRSDRRDEIHKELVERAMTMRDLASQVYAQAVHMRKYGVLLTARLWNANAFEN